MKELYGKPFFSLLGRDGSPPLLRTQPGRYWLSPATHWSKRGASATYKPKISSWGVVAQRLQNPKLE
jgi:hypothetical protein